MNYCQIEMRRVAAHKRAYRWGKTPSSPNDNIPGVSCGYSVVMKSADKDTIASANFLTGHILQYVELSVRSAGQRRNGGSGMNFAFFLLFYG